MSGTRHYVIHWKRLGRRSGTFDQTIVVPDTDAFVDALADSVYREARKRLLSREFDVTVTMEPDERHGTVHVEYGRFGHGTVELLEVTQ